ncbi:hypothetical protein [uncultured Mediterranean phage uvMED]|nr:hypothetical protein [uncultured Mediterranean phage uvMED]|tara:strand:+ start:3922 stop:4905 length:984 start_codon:yes stop_codon:yes gene_type:complete
MSSIYSAFCNNHSDLQSVISDIDKYDRKRVLMTNFVASGVSNLYYLHNAGYVDQLYMDGAEQTKVTDTPNAMNEYEYDSNSDRLQVYIGGSSASDMNTKVFEAGQDWSALKTTVCKEQADMMRSYLNRPIYKKLNSTYQGASERSYDFIVVRINAILACADLVRSMDPEKADAIEAMAMNDDSTGLLDKLKRREYVMSNETSFASEKGVIQEISVNANTTGYIEDIKLNGPPSVDYDEVRVVISTGGTFAVGTASPVKYDVYVKDDTGIRMQKVVSAEQMSGDYQQLAYGAQIRFQAGVYTSSDEFAIIFQSSEIPIGTVKSGQIYR